jgi:hypothetical protein
VEKSGLKWALTLDGRIVAAFLTERRAKMMAEAATRDTPPPCEYRVLPLIDALTAPKAETPNVDETEGGLCGAELNEWVCNLPRGHAHSHKAMSNDYIMHQWETPKAETPAGERPVVEAAEVHLFMAARDCLIQHRGCWADQDQPTVKVGERIRFTCHGDLVEEGVVTKIEAPGETSREDMAAMQHWWKVHYTPAERVTEKAAMQPGFVEVR